MYAYMRDQRRPLEVRSARRRAGAGRTGTDPPGHGRAGREGPALPRAVRRDQGADRRLLGPGVRESGAGHRDRRARHPLPRTRGRHERPGWSSAPSWTAPEQIPAWTRPRDSRAPRAALLEAAGGPAEAVACGQCPSSSAAPHRALPVGRGARVRRVRDVHPWPHPPGGGLHPLLATAPGPRGRLLPVRRTTAPTSWCSWSSIPNGWTRRCATRRSSPGARSSRTSIGRFRWRPWWTWRCGSPRRVVRGRPLRAVLRIRPGPGRLPVAGSRPVRQYVPPTGSRMTVQRAPSAEEHGTEPLVVGAYRLYVRAGDVEVGGGGAGGVEALQEDAEGEPGGWPEQVELRERAGDSHPVRALQKATSASKRVGATSRHTWSRRLVVPVGPWDDRRPRRLAVPADRAERLTTGERRTTRSSSAATISARSRRADSASAVRPRRRGRDGRRPRPRRRPAP